MTSPRSAPYGSWTSPLTSESITAGTLGLSDIVLDGADIYWSESRPTEGGRSVIVRRTSDGRTQDMTPAPFNVRTRAHEYGGGAYAVADGTLYCSNFADQRLYRLVPGSAPEPLTPDAALRYADAVVDKARGTLICVREDHRGEGEAVSTLVSVALSGDEAGGTVLVSGADFYSSPQLSPDGARLAWLTWNHPNMPWDGTELWSAPVGANGTLGAAELIAGGLDESVFGPRWSPDGVLYFVSDRTGWWNLYRRQSRGDEALAPMEAEFGLPQWVFGLSTYGFSTASDVICWSTRDGADHLARLDAATGALTPLDLPYTEIDSVRVAPTYAVILAASLTEPTAVVRLDLTTGSTEVLRHASTFTVDPGYLSTPRPITFPTENGLVAHGIFYPPHNRDFVAPEGEKPVLIVRSHGGPTSFTGSGFNLGVQFWTSRGFAVLDVNYGGSTGYGRAYRQRLDGQWGIVDRDDCVNGARYLAEQGLVDGERMAITGGSAGGYTTLCALTFRDAFKAGASHYGVSDVEALMRDTHKFESRYGDHLIGPYPEARSVYYERSPIHFAHLLSCPVIFFQGQDDRVVPPSQAEEMVAALRERGLPVAYIAYEGEGHGFRRAENIRRSLDAELYFYGRVFGFDPSDHTEPVHIENM